MLSLRSATLQAVLDDDGSVAAVDLTRYDRLLQAASSLSPFADTPFEKASLDQLLSAIRECHAHALAVASAERLRDGPSAVRAARDLLASSDAAQREAQALVTFNASQVQSAARYLQRSLWDLAVESSVAAAIVIGSAFLLFRLALTSFRSYSGLVENREREASAFASRAAHELRGPLQSILLGIELARRTSDSGPLQSADRGAQHLERIVSRLLEFARSGGAPVPGATCDVVQVVDRVVGELSPSFRQLGVVVTRQVGPVLRVGLDETYAHIILLNLATNVLTYGHRGEGGACRITARQVRGAAQNQVEDDGPGIAAAGLPFVFDPLFQGAARSDGIGLGLATVKRLVVAHGGDVTVESAEGKGTRVRISLPLSPPPAKALAHAPARAAAG